MMERLTFLKRLAAIPIAAVLPNAIPPQEPDTSEHDGPELSPEPSAPPRGASEGRRERKQRLMEERRTACRITPTDGSWSVHPTQWGLPHDAILISRTLDRRKGEVWLAWVHESFDAKPRTAWPFSREQHLGPEPWQCRPEMGRFRIGRMLRWARKTDGMLEMVAREGGEWIS